MTLMQELTIVNMDHSKTFGVWIIILEPKPCSSLMFNLNCAAYLSMRLFVLISDHAVSSQSRASANASGLFFSKWLSRLFESSGSMIDVWLAASSELYGELHWATNYRTENEIVGAHPCKSSSSRSPKPKSSSAIPSRPFCCSLMASCNSNSFASSSSEFSSAAFDE